jgi:hypothetical protein
MSGPQLNTLLSIDSVWMAVSVDDDGTEGVCALNVNGQWFPLIAADEKRLPFVLAQAEMIAKRDQRLVRIIKLTSREEFKVIDGRT